MKKSNLITFFICVIAFILGVANISLANSYLPSDSGVLTAGILNIVLFKILEVLAVIFVISLIGIIVAKIKNQNEICDKRKMFCENILYYFLFMGGFVWLIKCIGDIISLFTVGIRKKGVILILIPLIALSCSLYLRLILKKKKVSYLVLVVYMILMAWLFFI